MPPRFAGGPRATRQRQLINQAMAPIWEANHVWLILVVVLLFSAFPAAYAAASVALHVPLFAMLVGIVLRGSAFVFRHYSPESERAQRRWGAVFAISSVATPVCLGVVLGAITAGLRVENGRPEEGFVAPWLRPFPFATGGFVLAVFAFLAAVYLTNESDDAALQEDFRRRALGAGVAVFVLAWLSLLLLGDGAFRRALFGSWWSWPLQISGGAVALGALVALYRRRYRLARPLAALQVAMIVGGWGLAQRPYLIAPDLTLKSAAAPAPVLGALAVALAVGALLLFPSLWWLYRVFKRR
jgi:cytochrome d ubiquinol oxidase subunit II